MKKKLMIVITMVVVLIVGCSSSDVKYKSYSMESNGLDNESQTTEYYYKIVLSGSEDYLKELEIVELKLNEAYESLVLDQSKPIGNVDETEKTLYVISGTIVLNTEDMSEKSKREIDLMDRVIVKAADNMEIDVKIK